MKKAVTIFLSVIFLLLIACGKNEEPQHSGMKRIDSRKPMAWGNRRTVYAVCDKFLWKYAESHLRNSLERFQFTTVNEKYFDVNLTEFDALEQFYKYNNLIFFCALDSDDQVSAHVKSIMNEDVKKQVAEEGVGIFPVENLWANDQYVLFLIGDTQENLLKLNILQANEIFNLFKEKLISRIALKIYQQKIHLEKNFAKYPWYMKIPQRYVVFREDEQFISFLSRLRNQPDKFVAVYCEDMETNEVTKDWLVEKRLEIFGKYYEGDSFKMEDIRLERNKFNSYSGVKISGRWQNEITVSGGAFQSFAFYDEATKKAYIIDNTVYYPEGDKLEALLELEVISKTLVIKE